MKKIILILLTSLSLSAWAMGTKYSSFLELSGAMNFSLSKDSLYQVAGGGGSVAYGRQLHSSGFLLVNLGMDQFDNSRNMIIYGNKGSSSENTGYKSFNQFVSILYEQELAKGIFIPAIAFGPSIGAGQIGSVGSEALLGLGVNINLSLKIGLHRRWQGLVGTHVKYGSAITALSEGVLAHGFVVGMRFLF